MSHYAEEELKTYAAALARHAATQGLLMNPDWETAKPLLEGLLDNGARFGLRTCPCRPAHGDKEKDRDIACPCAYAKADVDEYGACYCWLFVSQAWADGSIAHCQVPERRPPEKTLGIG